METVTKKKELYEVPNVRIIEIESEGIICSSKTTGEDFIDNETSYGDGIDVWG